MTRGRDITAVIACVVFAWIRSVAAPIELRPDDVVVFVGGTDMARMQMDGRLEAALTHRFREHTPTFRDLSWEGDTVYFQSTVGERWRRQAFGGWQEQLARLRATVIIVQFGKIESLEGADRLDDFKKAYETFLGLCRADGRRIVLLAPAPAIWTGANRGGHPPHAAETAAALELFTKTVETLAGQHGDGFVPLDPNDPVGGFIRGLTGSSEPEGDAIKVLRPAVREKHRLWREYWRPANWKCLFGDDSKRIFSVGGDGLASFQEEWATYPGLIDAAETRVRTGASWEPPVAPPLSGAREADVTEELASFEVLDGFEVNLFADESHGVANPLSVRWDADGRMYVACSDVYPQIKPGVRPNDRIVALRDLDGDGRADESNVFADGLNIPTGMEVGHDRTYVGQGTELLALRDTNGDGVANERTVLLSGFGNGDSHQTINSFVWSPGGELWFCQGDGIESRVETPFGVSTLFQAGVFRLRPRELRLDGLLDDFMGPGNPWGVAFDDFGQAFVIDGAGGVSYLTPGSIPAKRRLKLPRIGKPGGYCGIECLGAKTFPADMQGEFLIGDYKKNQVSRFAAIEDGAGFKVAWREPFLRSNHRNFRPVDVKVGPDGAVYVVDWYNPITCHQDDFYRHPDRDTKHGRIWRIAPKSGSLTLPRLASASTGALVDALESTERWTRLKAKQVLATRDPEEVLTAVGDWRKGDRQSGPDSALREVEVLALLAWLDIPGRKVVERLLHASDHRARACAARVVGRWGARLENAHALLEIAAADAHPQVRMEALLACAAIPDPRSVLIAAAVAEAPRDQWIDYAFAQAVHHLKPHWLPAFKRGALDFGRHRRGLAAVLGAVDSGQVVADIRQLLESGAGAGADGIGDGDVGGIEARWILARTLAAVGDDDDLRLVMDINPPNPAVLLELAARERPEVDFIRSLRRAIAWDDPAVRVAAMALVGHWRVDELRDHAVRIAIAADSDTDSDPVMRATAIRALGSLGGEDAVTTLKALSDGGSDFQVMAASALLAIDPVHATQSAAGILAQTDRTGVIGEVFRAFASREGAGQQLAMELRERGINRALARTLREVWIATGLVDTELTRTLDDLAGVTAAPFEFRAGLVDELVAASRKDGDPLRGAAVFHSARAGCAACHSVDGQGGVIGPDLSAVGGGVPADRIVAEVLWPARQVKEGYSLTQVTTTDGGVLQGYVQPSREEGSLLLRDFAAVTELHEIPIAQIRKRESVGSLMPPTAQALQRNELLDLFAYLFSLRGQTDGQ